MALSRAKLIRVFLVTLGGQICLLIWLSLPQLLVIEKDQRIQTIQFPEMKGQKKAFKTQPLAKGITRLSKNWIQNPELYLGFEPPQSGFKKTLFKRRYFHLVAPYHSLISPP